MHESTSLVELTRERSERLGLDLLKQLPIALTVYEGEDFRIRIANRTTQEIWGKTEDELVGKPVLEVSPEMEFSAPYKAALEVLRTGVPFEANEIPLTFLRNGVTQTSYFNVVYTAWKNENGDNKGVITVATDVTEAVLARRKIEESEEKYRSLFNTMEQGFCIIQMLFDTHHRPVDYRFIEVNPVFASQTGLTEAPGKTARELLPGLEQHWIDAYGKVALTGESVRFIGDSDAMGRWFEVYAFRRSPDFPDHVAILFSDITNRVQTVEALRVARDESEKRKRLLETVTNTTEDLHYVFDLDYKFTYANSALLRMWGRSWEDAIGRGLRDLGYEEWHAAMHEREIDKVVATRKSVRGIVSFPHAELGERIYDYIFSPVINEQGEVEAIAGTTRDISELKQTERALKESEMRYRNLVGQLEQAVAERTKELQRSNDDLEQFAHVASHDLKEPVRKVSIFSSRLKEEFGSEISEHAMQYVAKIESAAQRMNEMINGVLNYAVVGELDIPEDRVDLGNVFESIVNDLELPIREKSAEIRIGAMLPVKGSQVLLYQLFYNLINNSLKFSSRERMPVVAVLSQMADDKDLVRAKLPADGSFIKIYVTDNGIGFQPHEAERIFQSFTRLHGKHEYEGTGLGLSLCKKIAERHGGAILAEGVPQLGATFTVLLPGVGS